MIHYILLITLFSLCLLFNISVSHAELSTTDPFSSLLLRRYSGYDYDLSKVVTHEQLLQILEAGRLAPSSYNEQPWNFIICNRATHPESYVRALSTLVEFNQNWAKNAPILIVSVAASKSSRKDLFNRWGQYDTGAAAYSMMLQATSLGLMAHQMGGFDEGKIREAFSIPEDFTPMSVMAIGYPSSNTTQPERKRKPFSDHFFIDTWGKKFELLLTP